MTDYYTYKLGEATLFSQRHVSATHIQFNVNKGTTMFIFHVNQLLTVASGILTMHMDESTFERSGLSDNIGLVKGQRMRSTWKSCCHHLKEFVLITM